MEEIQVSDKTHCEKPIIEKPPANSLHLKYMTYVSSTVRSCLTTSPALPPILSVTLHILPALYRHIEGWQAASVRRMRRQS